MLLSALGQLWYLWRFQACRTLSTNTTWIKMNINVGKSRNSNSKKSHTYSNLWNFLFPMWTQTTYQCSWLVCEADPVLDWIDFFFFGICPFERTSHLQADQPRHVLFGKNYCFLVEFSAGVWLGHKCSRTCTDFTRTVYAAVLCAALAAACSAA